MKSLVLLFAICQLAVAVNIAPVVVGGNTADSCPEIQTQEMAIQSLSNSTIALAAKISSMSRWNLVSVSWYQHVYC